jgi:hypothetical protein
VNITIDVVLKGSEIHNRSPAITTCYIELSHSLNGLVNFKI